MPSKVFRRTRISQPPIQALVLRPVLSMVAHGQLGGASLLGNLIAGALPKETRLIHQLYGESLLFAHIPP